MTSQMGGQGGREAADAWGSGGEVPQPAGGPPTPAKTSGLAIASLVLGILGLVSCGLAAIPGLILGVVALVRIGRSRGALGGKGYAVAGTTVSVVFILLGFAAAALLWRGAATIKVVVETVICATQLRSIGTGITMHRSDAGEFPEKLEDLWPEHVKSRGVFRCPGDQNPMTIGEDIECSYHYVGPLSPAGDPRVILVYEKEGNHLLPEKGDSHLSGRNVLFADNHVEFILEEEFRARLSESLQLVRQVGWEDYSEERRAEIEAFYEGLPTR